MTDYDFSCLNDKEFEALTTDILSVHFDCHIERFKGGKDGGVDGRFFSDKSKEIVIQCKHWLKSGLSALQRSLKEKEFDKVVKLNPSRYIFVTSLELSRVNKIKIRKIFYPYIKQDSDIFGNEDLNVILSKNPQIEQKHYKLWLTSTNVLKIILNSAIIGRSTSKLDEIIENSSRYVITENHKLALDKLQKLHTVIIKGEPGIGKTSLADQLCQYYTANGYELCYIENSLNEAESHYDNDEQKKQIFYFDDFLGRNFLLALQYHQDSHILNFIKRVKRDPKKRFILTSRSNILNQGKQLSDLFGIEHIDENEYEISVSSLSNIDKAKILYNHIWFSSLEESYVDQLYKEKRYKKIIDHKNFNPRLISFITDSRRLKTIDPSNYWQYINTTLENPHGVWGNVFDVQLSAIGKNIVVGVVIHGKKITETELKKFFYNLKKVNLNDSNEVTYESTTRILVGALLDRTVYNDSEPTYNLFNPSIADYVISTYLCDIDYICKIICCLKTTESIDNIYSLHSSQIIDESVYRDLIKKILEGNISPNQTIKLDSFILRLMSSAIDISSVALETHSSIKNIVEELLNNEAITLDLHTFKIINWASELTIIKNTDIQLINLVKKILRNDYYEFEEYSVISKIIFRIEKSGGPLTKSFKEIFSEDYSDSITSRVIEAGVLDDLYDDNDCDLSEISNLLEDDISDFRIKFSTSELDAICECCNINDIVESNINASVDGYNEFIEKPSEPNDNLGVGDPIDDLFDRG